jgi:hypothetical protein
MFLFGDLIWFVGPSIHKLYFYALSKFGLQGTQVGIGVLVILLGLGVYRFKVKNQRFYWVGRNFRCWRTRGGNREADDCTESIDWGSGGAYWRDLCRESGSGQHCGWVEES